MNRELRIRQPRILFVGAFKPSAGGVVGGQLTACRGLMKSAIARRADWVLIDTTMRTLPPPSLGVRSIDAVKRLWLVCLELAFCRVDSVLIFASSGASFFEKGLMAFIAKSCGKRVVFCPRSGHMEASLSSYWTRIAVAAVFRQCAVVVCQSSFWRGIFSAVGKSSHAEFHVVKNWIDLDDRGMSLRGTEPPKILFMGWLVPEKGIYELLDAALWLRGRGFDFRVWICGRGSHEREVRHKIQASDLSSCVEMKGWVEGAAKRALFSEADVFVLPSYAEGMPNAVLEAMAAGLPVVGTHVGGVPDMVPEELRALLVQPRDSRALAESLARLLSDRRNWRNYGQLARTHVEKEHSIERLWPRILALLIPDRIGERVF
jgi:glycosyltransferase involved in cell wall biosynthesis